MYKRCPKISGKSCDSNYAIARAGTSPASRAAIFAAARATKLFALILRWTIFLEPKSLREDSAILLIATAKPYHSVDYQVIPIF